MTSLVDLDCHYERPYPRAITDSSTRKHAMDKGVGRIDIPTRTRGEDPIMGRQYGRVC
jgi:hypothetical protein